MLRFGVKEKPNSKPVKHEKRFLIRANYGYICEENGKYWIAVNAKMAKVVYNSELERTIERIVQQFGRKCRKTIECIPYTYTYTTKVK